MILSDKPRQALAGDLKGWRDSEVLRFDDGIGSIEVNRLAGNPIITKGQGEVGDNVNGPSLIKVPDWVHARLGKYYLYFAHHHGKSIRLAYADELEGPWRIHSGGCLRLSDSPFIHHIASPEIFIDEPNRRIVMYAHGPMAKEGGLSGEHRELGYDPKTQRSVAAVSSDGVHFDCFRQPVGPPYVRVFSHKGRRWAVAMGGWFFKVQNLLDRFIPMGRLGDDRTRHLAVDAREAYVDLYYTRVGDAPERILRQRAQLAQNGESWELGDPVEILQSETEYEGAHIAVEASALGAVYEPVHAVRDPAVLREGNRLFLAYAAAGETGIAIAEILEKPEVAFSENTQLLNLSVESRVVPSPVEIGVMLPPGYENGSEAYPLLLLLHGGGGSRDLLSSPRVMDSFNSAWDRGWLPPLVAVTPSAGRSFYMDYRDGSEKWETFIMEELLPALRRRLNVSRESGGTIVMGASMGGMGALRLGFKYPDEFEAIAALMPAIEPVEAFEDLDPEDRSYRSDEIYMEIFGNPIDTSYWQVNHPIYLASSKLAELKDSGLQIYLECGDEDPFFLFRGAEKLHRILYDGDLKHEYRLLRGEGHGGPLMNRRYLNALEFVGRVLHRDP